MTRAGALDLQGEAGGAVLAQPRAETASGGSPSSTPVSTSCVLDMSLIKIKSDNFSTKLQGHYGTWDGSLFFYILSSLCLKVWEQLRTPDICFQEWTLEFVVLHVCQAFEELVLQGRVGGWPGVCLGRCGRRQSRVCVSNVFIFNCSEDWQTSQPSQICTLVLVTCKYAVRDNKEFLFCHCFGTISLSSRVPLSSPHFWCPVWGSRRLQKAQGNFAATRNPTGE